MPIKGHLVFRELLQILCELRPCPGGRLQSLVAVTSGEGHTLGGTAPRRGPLVQCALGAGHCGNAVLDGPFLALPWLHH